jgi:O-antigen ligase
MRAEVSEPEATQEFQPALLTNPREPHWDLAFFGMMGYLVVEYMRLSAQYPILLPLQVGKVVVGITFLGYLISHRRSGGDRSPVYSMDLAMGILVFASFVSACFAPDQDLAWATVSDLVRWAVIYFLIGRVVNNSWRLRLFIFLLLLLNLKMAQAAIRGYAQFKQAGMSEEAIAKFGVGAGSVGFFGNEGDFGVAMCVVWPLAGMLLMGEIKKIARIIFLVSLMGFTAAIFMSSSRGALVALVITAAFGWLKNPKRIFAGLIVGLILLASVYLVSPAYKARLESALHPEQDETASIRLNLWKAGLRMFASHPILGVGPGNFPPAYYSEHSGVEVGKIITAPHNIFIQALSELGLMGLLPILALMIFLFRINARTRKLLRATGEDGQRRFEYRMATALDLALIAYVVSGSFLTVLYYPHLWVLLGMSVATYNCCACLEKEARGPAFMPSALPINLREAGI